MSSYQEILDNTCSECECRVILQEYITVVDGKNYCGACYNEVPNNEVPNNEGPNNEVPNNEVPNNEVPNEPKQVNCHTCDKIFCEYDMRTDAENNSYCDDCWENKYDYCDPCEKIVNKDQNPYEYDENNKLQCVCKDCQGKWIENVAKIRESRMGDIMNIEKGERPEKYKREYKFQ
jgi:hypothetical protein